MQPFARHFLALTLGLSLCTAAFATPTDDIRRALSANAVTDVSTVPARQFLKPFTAVAFRVQPRVLPDYVIAGINLRPDLAPQLVAVAVKAAVRNLEGKPEALCPLIQRIVEAAVAANPDAAANIARAGASAAPHFRRCAVEAAIAAAPKAQQAIIEATTKTLPLAFIYSADAGTAGFFFTAATLNPANISEPETDTGVNSPEQPPSH